MKENRKRYQCPNCGWTVSEELTRMMGGHGEIGGKFYEQRK